MKLTGIVMASCQNFLFEMPILLRAIAVAGLFSVSWGQGTEYIAESPGPTSVSQPAQSAASEDSVREHIAKLNAHSYRTRQMARTFLEENPLSSLAVIGDCILAVETVVGLQLVDLLSGLAVHSDFEVSEAATEILAEIAGEATTIGRCSANSLRAIADIQEEKAVEILSNQGAYIGPQNFSINGRVDRSGGPLALRIDNNFLGSDSDLDWIRFLKSIQVVYLRGTKITASALQALSQLKQVRAIRLRNVQITPQQLVMLQELGSLEHLELCYMDIDDSYIPSILQLPINQSIRLYGTQVSDLGEQQLNESLDGIEIFRGEGGFLGISSISRQAQVDQVTPGSAAAQAGLLPGDIIISINNVPVATFDELRLELGKYRVGDNIDILLKRPSQDRFRQPLDWIEMSLQAKLQEEDS
jgi:hypothetical protein